MPHAFSRGTSGLVDDLEEKPSIEIVPAVAEGRADLGIVADITDLARLETHVVALDRLVIVASRAHRIAREAQVPFAEIIGEPFVGLADATLEMHLAERASRLGRQIDYRIQMRGLDNVGMLVEAGIGIAILSEVTANRLRTGARYRAALRTVGCAPPAAMHARLRCAHAAYEPACPPVDRRRGMSLAACPGTSE